ncbi:MAG TPA: DUF1254 domain-containing protein [Oligoflexus sp.]|uniref:DUF1254 domain-containing protein n=1 Tax=Oligoflexus sp. TaxID=1971216 RepID=UPI002D7EA5A0|nr:DUF1254 domain-containing protein [Oligoflexus sp.]HET9236634.1 DUF1254 domain-containing protein [Oligoflexus sp.]
MGFFLCGLGENLARKRTDLKPGSVRVYLSQVTKVSSKAAAPFVSHRPGGFPVYSFGNGWGFRYEMTTSIPEGIEMPAHVETRLGSLNFFDGFPNEESTTKLYDNLDFQRAVQAYLMALPPVSMVALREGLTQWGPANTTIPTFESLMDSRSLFLTANANTPYTWMWIDLHQGPLVAEIPPNVLGLINDFWFYYVTDVGQISPGCIRSRNPPALLPTPLSMFQGRLSVRLRRPTLSSGSI